MCYNEDMNQEIIKYFLSKKRMTPMKLSGLLYFAYAWSNAVLGENLKGMIFVATKNGPEELHVLKAFNPRRKINKIKEDVDLDRETKNYLEAVWRTYSQFSDKKLMKIAKSHNPWKRTALNETIDDRSIRGFYSAITK